MSWLIYGFDVGDLAKTVIGAGSGSFIAQSIFTVWREKKPRQERAASLALRLAAVLEDFTFACSKAVSYNQNPEQVFGEQYPSWQISYPDLAPFAEDPEGWRALDKNLAIRCMDLRHNIIAGQDIVDAPTEYSEDDLGDIAITYLGKQGVAGWDLASDLRSSSKVGSAKPLYDYAGIMRSAIRKSETEMAERRASNAATMERIGRDLAERGDVAYRN